MENPIELKEALQQFIGTDEWTRHTLNREMLLTDGVRFFAENAGGGAYWLTDIIATEVFPLLGQEAFIHIKMIVADEAAVIIGDDGNDNTLWQQRIEFTDCPQGEWHFYLKDNVLLLPSEY